MQHGSSAVIWKTDEWKLVKLEVLSTHIIVAEFLNVDGGKLQVLVGHMDCEPGARKRQWDQVQTHLSVSHELPMLSFIDPNSVIIPGVDSADLPRELPETVKAQGCESLVLVELDVEDVWVHLHREHRDNAVTGFAYPSLSRKIDRIHLSLELQPFVRSVYTAVTTSDRPPRLGAPAEG